MIYRRAKDKPEVVDPSDIPLSAEEALAVAACTDNWPGGLGEVLIPCSKSKRGYRRDPDFNHFKSYKPPENALLCPVMVVKQHRGWANGQYQLHLSAWRSLRDAYAKVLGCELKVARAAYNEDLRSNPAQVSKTMRAYVSML